MPAAVSADPIAQAVERARRSGEIRVSAGCPVTDEFLHELNAKYEIVAFQAASETELLISPPPGGPSALIHGNIYYQLITWVLAAIGGQGLTSDQGYHPPTGKARIPDASWLSPGLHKVTSYTCKVNGLSYSLIPRPFPPPVRRPGNEDLVHYTVKVTGYSSLIPFNCACARTTLHGL